LTVDLQKMFTKQVIDREPSWSKLAGKVTDFLMTSRHVV